MKKLIATTMVLALVSTALPALARGQPELAPARQATAKFHKVSHAEDADYLSTLTTLGCFENPGVGGMGLHYLNEEFLNDGVAVADEPEALVYEMRSNGRLKLVALEYLVPITGDETAPPMLFGQHFHQHPVLPFWILHVWIWNPNPRGMFADWNPRVGDCPEGVPVFGEDLP